MKSLFDAHKKDVLPNEQITFLQELKEGIQSYPLQEENENSARWKLTFLAKQIGLNITALEDEEIRVLMKALQRSEKYKRAKRQGKRRR